MIFETCAYLNFLLPFFLQEKQEHSAILESLKKTPID